MGRLTGVPWKFAPVSVQPLLGNEDRVVADAVELDLHLRARESQSVVGRSDDLRRRPHRVRVLDLRLDLAGGEIALGDALRDGRGAADGAGEAAQLVELGVVGLEVGEERLEGHRAGDLGLPQPAVHVVTEQRAHGREHVGAVDGREAVARLQARDGDAGPLERHAPRETLTLVEGLALAHQHEGHLGHGGEVAGGAHRAFLAHDRRDAAVEHLHERQGDLRPVAGVAVGVDVDASGHGGADRLDGRRFADAGRVVVNEIALKLLHLLVVEHHLAELADTGVGAVHDLARLDLVFEHLATDADALDCRRGELHLLAHPRDAHQLVDRQRAAVKNDRHVPLLFHCGQERRAAGANDGGRRPWFLSVHPRPDRRRCKRGQRLSHIEDATYGHDGADAYDVSRVRGV